MAETKKVKASLKMKLKAGQASAAPPVGSTLGQHGVNMMDFINPFNEQTRDLGNVTVTAHINIYEDRTMDFRVIGEPVDDAIRRILGIDKGSGKPNTEKVAKKLTNSQVEEIASAKMKDMNANDLEAAKKIVAGTARSMGVVVED
jgi:large subunit ribosomal protein L11